METLRVATKRINIRINQLEMKMKVMIELAGLMMLEEVGNEIERRKLWNNGQEDALTISRRIGRESCSKRSTTWCGVVMKRK